MPRSTHVRQRIVGPVVFSLLLLFTGCGSRSGNAAPAGKPFKNPVYTFDFPDPYVLKVGNVYYAYATSSIGGGTNIPELRSRDLVHWRENGDALPIPPRWEDKNLWGPTVLPRPDGKYVMYYSADYPPSYGQCLTRAVGASPAGPYHDLSNKPFMCQEKLGGAIDPGIFRDRDGKVYLYWKNDGNHNGNSTFIWVQRLGADAMTFLGKPIKLIDNTQGWEQDVIEAPAMVNHDGKYFLFFSGNHWDSVSYAVGYASCRGPEGPCTQAANDPILSYHRGCQAYGPGGETVTTDARGGTWILYHAWLGNATAYGGVGGKRVFWLDPLHWKDGKPLPLTPTCTAQPGPVMTK